MSIGYGDFIKRHRITSGFKTQKSFANKTGITAATISRIESEIQKPEIGTLQVIAQYLPSTSLGELMNVCKYNQKKDINHEELIVKLELSNLNLLEKYLLQIDGQTLTSQELKTVIAVVKGLRKSND